MFHCYLKLNSIILLCVCKILCKKNTKTLSELKVMQKICKKMSNKIMSVLFRESRDIWAKVLYRLTDRQANL